MSQVYAVHKSGSGSGSKSKFRLRSRSRSRFRPTQALQRLVRCRRWGLTGEGLLGSSCLVGLRQSLARILEGVEFVHSQGSSCQAMPLSQLLAACRRLGKATRDGGSRRGRHGPSGLRGPGVAVCPPVHAVHTVHVVHWATLISSVWPTAAVCPTPIPRGLSPSKDAVRGRDWCNPATVYRAHRILRPSYAARSIRSGIPAGHSTKYCRSRCSARLPALKTDTGRW